MTREEFMTAVIQKIKRFDAQQYRKAFYKGTKKAFKHYQEEVLKFIEYRSKDIERWNLENPKYPISNIFETEEDRIYWFEHN